MSTIKVVILAAGRGSRMVRDNSAAEMSDQQAAVADSGVKALIPIDRPFLDYVLSNIADAGFRHVCLVIGPRHDALRDYYTSLRCERLTIDFAIQQQPLGTADALAAAADFAGEDDFVLLNSDNLYPAHVLEQLRHAERNALVGFDRQGLLHQSNISAERMAGYALIESDAEQRLQSIHEKPTPEQLAGLVEPIRVSMNCWRFTSSIFSACGAIGPSPRGEYELPDAVRYSMHQLHEQFAMLPVSEPVLDLSSRDDIAKVTQLLHGVEVRL